MPKNLNLWGKYLRLVGRGARRGFKKWQVIPPIPVKAYGREPSAASQTGLYHDEDFNYHTKRTFSMRRTRRKLKPNVFRQTFTSDLLNTTIPNVRVTTSALHAMDDMGGFDAYILRTPPQELRSHMGERMRQVMYFYQEQPAIRDWGLPWKVFLKVSSRRDPFYACYRHNLRKQQYEADLRMRVRNFSPYYLPSAHQVHPERQIFHEGAPEKPALDLWWRESKELEEAFRRRLGEAKGFERAFADSSEEAGYRKGRARGGGGKSGRSVRRRSKTHKQRENRAF
ncbi:putative ribosomal protein L28 [Besnoitia besnoiti]|uniref:Putative ribosomal protein L28 n=1 Tax=Besnoitia besnoiti TaxID=94643 RepID=A0A2A9MHS9_BESBE|nr:putative ribosomal protein L28 [Besnoitia besnoiti]PFH35147.1 putative ribosomal protein L28 [Besnoitia besnoiti]